jgi:microcystin-dependent protein
MDGDILVWDGDDWVAEQPPADTEQDNMQPWLALNYIIALVGTYPSRNSTEPFIAEIIIFGGNFAPRGWAFCDGQLLSINSNTALFSLLGVTYGGDGRTTFGLPDLRGRAPIHAGNGPGLTPRALGAKGGVETHPL